jgi:hypothetical protein
MQDDAVTSNAKGKRRPPVSDEEVCAGDLADD